MKGKPIRPEERFASGRHPNLYTRRERREPVVQEGHLTFQTGDEPHALGADDIAILPPGVAHKFTNDGPGRSKLVCVHASKTIIGKWLE